MIGMKRVVAAVLCALVALTIALYLLVIRPLLRPSDVTAVAEGALLTEDLLLLGSINVKQAAFLEKWLFGAPQVTAVRGEPALPHQRRGGPSCRHIGGPLQPGRHQHVSDSRAEGDAPGRRGARLLRGGADGSLHVPAGRDLGGHCDRRMDRARRSVITSGPPRALREPPRREQREARLVAGARSSGSCERGDPWSRPPGDGHGAAVHEELGEGPGRADGSVRPRLSRPRGEDGSAAGRSSYRRRREGC